MPQGVTIPNNFTAETDALADEVNTNFQAIQAKFGAIVDGDIAPNPDIDGNKLSQTAGKQIPTGALAPTAVTDVKLANNTSTLSSDDGFRAASGDHIKSLTQAHVRRVLPATTGTPATTGLGLDKLCMTLYTSATLDSGALPRNYFATHVPSTVFPVATYTPVGSPWIEVSGVSGATNLLTACQFAQTAGNWNIIVTLNYGGSAGGATSIVKALFIKAVT